MIVLEPDAFTGIVLSAAQALDNDQYYAMVGLMQSSSRCIQE